MSLSTSYAMRGIWHACYKKSGCNVVDLAVYEYREGDAGNICTRLNSLTFLISAHTHQDILTVSCRFSTWKLLLSYNWALNMWQAELSFLSTDGSGSTVASGCGCNRNHIAQQ